MYWVVLEIGIDIYAPIDNLITYSIMLSRRIPEDVLKNYEILRKIIDLHIAIAVVTMQFVDWVICRNRDVYHVADTIVSISRLVNRINAIKELDFAKTDSEIMRILNLMVETIETGLAMRMGEAVFKCLTNPNSS